MPPVPPSGSAIATVKIALSFASCNYLSVTCRIINSLITLKCVQLPILIKQTTFTAVAIHCSNYVLGLFLNTSEKPKALAEKLHGSTGNKLKYI